MRFHRQTCIVYQNKTKNLNYSLTPSERLASGMEATDGRLRRLSGSDIAAICVLKNH